MPIIDARYYSKCWREGTGVILHKPGEDRTISKGYRIITLLNCLVKIAKKIIATRIAYLAENLLYGKNILDHEQIGGRK